jgi:FixJ family two-component response regulator
LTKQNHPFIAIVDDDSSVRRSLCRLVKAFGYQVESFDSAETYLNSNHSVSPDCLVLDLHMPGLSGIELHKKLRETGGQIPVIFITAHDDLRTRETIPEVGVIDFLSKPFKDEDLQKSLERSIQ